MRARTLIALVPVLLLALPLATGCATRQLAPGEIDRLEAVSAKIAKAERLDAVDCAPRELAVAKAELDHARHELAEEWDHKEGMESLAAAEKAADALLAKTTPCWEAKQAPTVTLAASPGTVERGKPATLTWSSTRAQEVAIEPGVGRVPAGGTREVRPSISTEYRITAKGTGGQAAATARVDVTEPPPPPPPPPPAATTFSNVHFDFDKAFIRADAKPALEAVAEYLRKNPEAKLLIEGHCDERGTAEYNMALGDRRAHAASKYLINLGIAGDRLSTVSFGEERPEDPGHTEEAWAKNRRAVFVLR